MPEVDTVMSALHRERLSIRTDGGSCPMPAWADWLIWLGAWLRSQAALSGRRVTVVLLPTRRLAAAFVGLGAMLAASRLHDDILDWDALQALPVGTLVHWRDLKGKSGRAVSYSGTVDGICDIDGNQFLAIVGQTPAKSKGVTYRLSRASALSYGVTRGAITKRGEDTLARAASLMKNIVDASSTTWIRSPMADSTVITERFSFLADLDGVFLEADNVPGVPLRETLALTDSEGRHGKLRLIPVRGMDSDDILQGVTILDGARATSRLGQVSARSIVVLLDHADFDEEVANLLNRFLSYSVDEGIHFDEGANPVVAPPTSIDSFIFALPEGKDIFDSAI